MHEMALTRNVVDIVLEEARKAEATEVRAVHLTIGYARDIVEDLFDKLFAHLARGTVAEHAELHITRIPLTVKCNACGFIYHIDVFDKETWTCKRCHETDYVLNSGMEFYVNNIEVVSAKQPETNAAPA